MVPRFFHIINIYLSHLLHHFLLKKYENSMTHWNFYPLNTFSDQNLQFSIHSICLQCAVMKWRCHFVKINLQGFLNCSRRLYINPQKRGIWMMSHSDCSAISLHVYVLHSMMQCHAGKCCVICRVNRHGFYWSPLWLFHCNFTNLMYSVCRIYMLFMFISDCFYAYKFRLGELLII
jgi:hypothetical protein